MAATFRRSVQQDVMIQGGIAGIATIAGTMILLLASTCAGIPATTGMDVQRFLIPSSI